MAIVLMSIRPAYTDLILRDIKRFEYRRVIPKRTITQMLIYETGLARAVVGVARIGEVLSGSPETIWNRSKDWSGISKDAFDLYFSECPVAAALSLTETKRFDPPLPLETFGISRPPQSYQYIDEGIIQDNELEGLLFS